MKKGINNGKVSITINNNLMQEFRDYCKEKGYKISTRLAVAMQKDMEKNWWSEENGKH